MNTQKQTAKYTLKYSAIQGSYWPVYCACMGFASVYLLAKGFTNSQIGLILALANIFAVFLQPAVATFADTTTKLSLKHLTALISFFAAVLTFILLLASKNILMLAILFILILTLLFTLQPLSSALGMHMINRGVPVNFGLARGIGSLAFAVFSYIIGILIERFGTDSDMLVALVMLLSYTFFTITFADNSYFKPEKHTVIKKESLGVVAFAKKYKRFMLLLSAVATTFIGHMMINNYFIQIIEQVGGNAKNMGTAIGLAAAIELPAMSLFMYFIRRFPCSSILKLSFVFFLVKAALTFFAGNVWMIYAAQLLQFASYAVFIPASIYYVNQVIGENDLVKGQSFMTSAITLSGVLASLIGGVILDGPGVRTMLFTGMITSAAGLLLCLPAIEATPVPGRKQQPD